MTEIRKSIVFKKELGEFGSSTAKASAKETTGWCLFPMGTHFSFTAARQAEGIYGAGNKFREGAAYGPFSGTWNLSFILDYDRLEPFEMIFENVTYSTDNKTITFEKKNNSRVSHYAFRVKQMNRIAGGSEGSDEVTILTGCVAKQISISRSAQSSQATVEMNGSFANMETLLGKLDSTDYKSYPDDEEIAQYSCMFKGDANDSNYVADVDAHTVSVENAISYVYSTCKAFASNYFEGRTTIQWNAQTYSNDPKKKFRLLPNSGGMDSTHLSPMCKGLKPMSKVKFVSFSGTVCKDDGGAENSEYNEKIAEAIKASNYSFDIELYNSVVKSITYSKGEGGKMSDSLSSVDCSGIKITVKRNEGEGDGKKLWAETISSPDPTSTPTSAPTPDPTPAK